ncbi:TRAP transporter small permease subunit [Pararhizobium haloflavum]|uniref:TRAP transporter small permease subunit n=1 Tax=Pararhizobium haloflavum TaxID=2037914 RepID=UPI000C17B127|nr:TRAP transporter small permease [Pararhizobium haloflavum]
MAKDDADLVEELEGPTGPIEEAGPLGRVIDRIAIVFAIGILLAMAVLIFEIVMRYGFGSPTLWAHETSIFLSAVAFVFGGLYCVAHDKHIRVVLIYDQLEARGRRWMDIVISLICCLSAGFFAYAAWLMVSRAVWAPDGRIRLEGTGSAWNPPTPALLKVFLLVVLVVMALQFVILAVNYARRGRRS